MHIRSSLLGACLLLLPFSAYCAPTPRPRLPAPAERTTISFADCNHILPTRALKQNSNAPDYLQDLLQILSNAGSPFALTIFEAAPSEMLWWVEVQGGMDLDDVSSAIHETAHLINAAASHCNNDLGAYFLNQKVWQTQAGMEQIPFASKWLPDHIKAIRKERFETYIASGRISNLAILLDEFSAYTGSSEFELAAVGTPIFEKFVAFELTMDNNLGGMVDFMLYFTIYLRGLREHYPDKWLVLRKSKESMEYIQQLWAKSELQLLEWEKKNITSYPLPKEVINEIFKPANLLELDRLGINHSQHLPVPTP